MRWFNAPLAEPTSAERIRTILTAADSMTVVTDEGRTEVSRLGGTGGTEHVHLHPAPGQADPDGVNGVNGIDGSASPGSVPATLEFTDVAPTPVRDRVRARVLLAGWLLPAGEHRGSDGSRCMEFGRAVLDRAGERTAVGLGELMEAESDPLATCEAGMLTHMTDDHGDLVELLTRLVKPRQPTAVRRALPLAMDRYGITLRLEYAMGHEDARLAFPSPVRDPDQAGERIRALLDSARGRSARGRTLRDSFRDS
ncbi:DUF2470 domain-containing protein [Streptomyces sp. NPDC058953]|uniref:DUF2470 domain-containing protein n=1 Tax=unclassified Streptomyces TaxID=2593676 RepID=UPI003694D4A9